MESNNVPIGPAPTLGANVSPEWMRWYDAVQQATQTVADSISSQASTTSDIATLKTSAASATSALAALRTAIAAAATLAGDNSFAGSNSFARPVTFQTAPIFRDVAGVRTALGITATTDPTLTLETNGSKNGLQTLLNLVAGDGISVSADGAGAVTIAKSSVIPSAPTYLYWRVQITATGGGPSSCTELKFYDTGGAAIATTSGVATASDSYAGSSGPYSPAKAFDSNAATFWAENSSPSSGSPGWLAYQFPSAVALGSFSWQARPDGEYAQSPTAFSIQASADGSAWTTLQSYTAAWSGAGQIQTFSVPVPVPVALSVGSVPATSTSAGTAGTLAWDTSYLYLAIAANTWRRLSLSTF